MIKTTWILRLGILLLLLIIGALTRGFWASQIGRSLVCPEDLVPSNVILLENLDPNYLLFERAAALERAGIAPTTLVLVETSSERGVPNLVSRGIAEIMARQARLEDWKIILFTEREPITLNAAAQLREHLAGEHITSLIVVTSGFRSRRSSLIYRAVLGDIGIRVHCAPVFGRKTIERWTETWHGIQEVAVEFLKLQYYRFYVLPFASRTNGR